MNNQQASPIIEVERASEESKHLAAIFNDMKSKQLEFLDESGKSVIERIATFLTVLFAVTAFSNNFPPAYLKGNVTAKSLVIATLLLYLLALGAGILVVQPRPYEYKESEVDFMRTSLQRLISHKMRWLCWAGILFTLGAITLGAITMGAITLGAITLGAINCARTEVVSASDVV